MTQASESQVNEFVKVVDEFMAKYARLTSSETRADVYGSGDAKLIADYESAVSKGGVLKSTIEATVGAWNAARAALREVTKTTSMYIGDAVDWLRKQFGHDPSAGLNGLGALQIPAAVWVAGIIAAAYALIKVFDKLFVSIEASKLQRENSQLSREQALKMAEGLIGNRGLFGGLTLPLGLLGLAAVVFLAMR